MTTPKVTGTLARWNLLPREYDFIVVHRAKTENANAARVMSKGFRQMGGLDNDRTFALTIIFERLRALVAVATSMGCELDQMDVATTFLYAKLGEETSVEIREGIGPV